MGIYFIFFFFAFVPQNDKEVFLGKKTKA